MKQEITVTGKTVEEAVSIGADKLGVDSAKVTYEVVEAPKKGFLGFGETPATVKVFYDITPERKALDFVRTIVDDMGLRADVELVHRPGNRREYLINVTGADAGALIGHHGETLDALQYLVGLAANRHDKDDSEHNFTLISVDVENYRQKREETLRRLAKRMASRVLKTHRSVTLEPMNPYERRIIHSQIQEIEGVTTVSIGTENNRRVMISIDDGASDDDGGSYDYE